MSSMLDQKPFPEASGSTPMLEHISWKWRLNSGSFRISCLCSLANVSKLPWKLDNWLESSANWKLSKLQEFRLFPPQGMLSCQKKCADLPGFQPTHLPLPQISYLQVFSFESHQHRLYVSLLSRLHLQNNTNSTIAVFFLTNFNK